MAQNHQYLRLAMRHEGSMWNAYAALMGTMDGAILLGSIQMACVQTEDRRLAFMAIMQDALAQIITEATGAQVQHWNDPVKAPEHERAGRA